MVYDMLNEYQRGEEQVENSITLATIRFCALHSMANFHEITAIGGRLHADGREA